MTTSAAKVYPSYAYDCQMDVDNGKDESDTNIIDATSIKIR